jgi:lysozyme
MRIRGLDVSSIQGVVDWNALVQRGVRFTMCRSGNGNNAPDRDFAADIAGARAAGLVVGAYHVGFPLPPSDAHPGRPAAEQAKAHFAASLGVGGNAGDLPPALDLEWPVPGSLEWQTFGCSREQVREWALEWLETATSLWGRKPLLYDGFPVYWAAIDGGSEPRFGDYPLWVVQYPEQYKGTIPPDSVEPIIPAPWTTWTLWQHSGGGFRLPNGTPVDSDLFNGDEAAFQAFLNRMA